MDVNITNILNVSPLDLSIWCVENLLNDRIPVMGPNSTSNVHVDILPLLPVVANKITVATEMYSLVVGATPTQSSIRGAEEKTDMKGLAEALNRKKDVLYRVIQTLESTRESVSRMMTGIYESNKVFGR